MEGKRRLINLDALADHLDDIIPDEVLMDEEATSKLLPDLTRSNLDIVRQASFDEFEHDDVFDSHHYNNPIIDLLEDF